MKEVEPARDMMQSAKGKSSPNLAGQLSKRSDDRHVISVLAQVSIDIKWHAPASLLV